MKMKFVVPFYFNEKLWYLLSLTNTLSISKFVTMITMTSLYVDIVHIFVYLSDLIGDIHLETRKGPNVQIFLE